MENNRRKEGRTQRFPGRKLTNKHSIKINMIDFGKCNGLDFQKLFSNTPMSFGCNIDIRQQETCSLG